MEISGGIDICQMSFPTGATAILLLVCILSLLSTKCPAQKHCAGQQDIKSERYSFVCVLRVDRLPGLDNPMQSPRHRARFPATSTPAGGLCPFRSQRFPAPGVPIRFPAQGHGQRASYFQERSFRLPQRCLRSHLPELKSRQARHNRGLRCFPLLLHLVLRSPVYIWGL